MRGDFHVIPSSPARVCCSEGCWYHCACHAVRGSFSPTGGFEQLDAPRRRAWCSETPKLASSSPDHRRPDGSALCCREDGCKSTKPQESGCFESSNFPRDDCGAELRATDGTHCDPLVSRKPRNCCWCERKCPSGRTTPPGREGECCPCCLPFDDANHLDWQLGGTSGGVLRPVEQAVAVARQEQHVGGRLGCDEDLRVACPLCSREI